MNTATIEKATLWQQRIAEYHSSNLSTTVWCEQRGLNVHTLRYWIKKLNDSQQENSDLSFIQLIPKADTTPQISGVSLRIGCYLIDVAYDYDELTLLRLLGTLKKC